MLEDAEFLSIKEMANLLRMHENTIRKYIKKGKIHAFIVGTRAYRIPRQEINKLCFEHLEKVINALIDKREETNKD